MIETGELGIPEIAKVLSDETARTFLRPCGVAVKELKLSYHNSEIVLLTMYPYYGNLIP